MAQKRHASGEAGTIHKVGHINDDPHSSSSNQLGSQKQKKATSSARMARQINLNSARKAVFETTELLERILLFLPGLDTVRSQRVCKHFQKVIAQCPDVPEKIWMRPSKDENPIWEVALGKVPGQAVTLFPDATLYRVRRILNTTGRWLPRVELRTAVAHPILSPVCFGVSSNDLQEFVHYVRLDLLRLLRQYHHSQLGYMYLTEPPVTTVTIEFAWTIRPGYSRSAKRLITDDNGITFGLIANSLREVPGWSQSGSLTTWLDIESRDSRKPKKSPADFLEQSEKALKKIAEPDYRQTGMMLCLHDVYLPTTKQWKVHAANIA